MKIWKIQEGLTSTVAYVQVMDSCSIFDSAYAALQLVRKKHPDKKHINGYQLLDVKNGEQMQAGIPVYTIS